MRDGPLKRFLLSGLFSAQEVARALGQAAGPAFTARQLTTRPIGAIGARVVSIPGS